MIFGASLTEVLTDQETHISFNMITSVREV